MIPVIRCLPYCLAMDENVSHDAPKGMSSKLPIIGSCLGPGGRRSFLLLSRLNSTARNKATRETPRAPGERTILNVVKIWIKFQVTSGIYIAVLINASCYVGSVDPSDPRPFYQSYPASTRRCRSMEVKGSH